MPSHIQLFVASNDYCSAEPSHIRMRHHPKFQRSISGQASAPKRIKQALQKQHRKAIPATLRPQSLSISTPSIFEGEVVPAKVSIFQQVEYKNQDCELITEQVDQTKMMQLISRPRDCVDGHAYLISSMIYEAAAIFNFRRRHDKFSTVIASEGDAKRQRHRYSSFLSQRHAKSIQ